MEAAGPDDGESSTLAQGPGFLAARELRRSDAAKRERIYPLYVRWLQTKNNREPTPACSLPGYPAAMVLT
jgi:hypothetical protein